MKKWTRRFIKKQLKVLNKATIEDGAGNAKNAKRKLGIPKELWLELSADRDLYEIYEQEINNSELDDYVKYRTMFLMGFIVGWVEKYNKLK